MPVKRKIPFSSGHFFITFTCYAWLPLIETTNGYDLFYDWFGYLKHQGHQITGYVIMPNHVHITVAFFQSAKGINTIIGDGKRFIGYGMVSRLKTMGRNDLLLKMADGVNKSDKKKGKLYEIWEDSFDWKECNGDQFINQKIDYMHNNPCAGKWQLAANPVEYRHSSARQYLTGEQGIYDVLNYQELNDLDLNSVQV